MSGATKLLFRILNILNIVVFSGDQLGADSGRRPDTAALGAQLYCFQMGQPDIDTVAGI